jgi:mono/diheme cytochrome c family protein
MARIKFVVLGAAMAMTAACASADHVSPSSPASGIEQDIGAARNPGASSQANTSADLLRSPVRPAVPWAPVTRAPSAVAVPDTHAEPKPGDIHAGRRFALANCRPCHVVAANQNSPIRFADAPTFHDIAAMPSTTRFSLDVWLRNPHPTMPSLILSRQEAADVIAYILSLHNSH